MHASVETTQNQQADTYISPRHEQKNEGLLRNFHHRCSTRARDGDARAVTTCLRDDADINASVLDRDGYTCTSTTKLVAIKRDVVSLSGSSALGLMPGSSCKHMVTTRASPSRARVPHESPTAPKKQKNTAAQRAPNCAEAAGNV